MQLMPTRKCAFPFRRDTGQTSNRTSSTTPASSRECMSSQAAPQPDVLTVVLLEFLDGADRVARDGRGGKVAQGASSSLDETTNLVSVLSSATSAARWACGQ